MTRGRKTPTNDEIEAMCFALGDEGEALLRDLFSHVADNWTLWALAEIAARGPLRFARVMERVEGVSQKSLTAVLRRLERNGLVTRTVVAQVPIRVDYAATPLGLSLIESLKPLWVWGAMHVPELQKAQARFDRAKTKHDAARRED